MTARAEVAITGVGGEPNPNPPDVPPTANAGPDVTGFEGSPVDLVGSASDDHGPPAESEICFRRLKTGVAQMYSDIDGLEL